MSDRGASASGLIDPRELEAHQRGGEWWQGRSRHVVPDGSRWVRDDGERAIAIGMSVASQERNSSAARPLVRAPLRSEQPREHGERVHRFRPRVEHAPVVRVALA